MRLDVLVSQAFSLSRNISEKLLKSQKYFIMERCVYQVDKRSNRAISYPCADMEVSGGRFRKNIKKKAVSLSHWRSFNRRDI